MKRRRRAAAVAAQQPVVVSFDASGAVEDIVGDLAQLLGDAEPQSATIQRLRDLLVGCAVLPVTLSGVELSQDRYVDVHIVEEGDALRHMVLLGNSDGMLALRDYQQLGNEAALSQERQLRALGRPPPRDVRSQLTLEPFRRTGNLFAGIAYAMRAPLAVLSAHAKALARQLAEEPAASASVAAIQQAAVQLDALSRNALVGLGRLSADSDGRGAVQLPQLAAWLQDTFALQAREAGVQLQLRVSRGSEAVLVDPLAVRQILTNLLVHALDGLRGVRLTLDLKAGARYLEMELACEPDGFAAERFGPLVTTHDLLLHHAEGSLGLAVSQTLLRQLRAQVELVRRQDGGCDLWCRVPVRGDRAANAPNPPGMPGDVLLALPKGTLAERIEAILVERGRRTIDPQRRGAGDGPLALAITAQGDDGASVMALRERLGIAADTVLLLIGDAAWGDQDSGFCVQLGADAGDATLAAVLDDLLAAEMLDPRA
ncbi:sensor histidine kinase [Xanthomonas sacchari]